MATIKIKYVAHVIFVLYNADLGQFYEDPKTSLKVSVIAFEEKNSFQKFQWHVKNMMLYLLTWWMHSGPHKESLGLKCVLTFALAMQTWLYPHLLKRRDTMKTAFSHGKNKPGNKRETSPAVLFIELVYFYQNLYRRDQSFCSTLANYFPKAKIRNKYQRSPHSDHAV